MSPFEGQRESAQTRWQALVARCGSLHLYGKSEIRPARKMGHITWLTPKDAGRRAD